jgi:hypothetical protein
MLRKIERGDHGCVFQRVLLPTSAAFDKKFDDIIVQVRWVLASITKSAGITRSCRRRGAGGAAKRRAIPASFVVGFGDAKNDKVDEAIVLLGCASDVYAAATIAHTRCCLVDERRASEKAGRGHRGGRRSLNELRSAC